MSKIAVVQTPPGLLDRERTIEKAELYPDPDTLVNSGDSLVIGPDGKTTAGPLRQEVEVVYADIDDVCRWCGSPLS